jgi:hypothetical protein
MKRMFKIMVLWLLVLVLPIQGVAAAAMVCCGSIHQHGTALQNDDHHAHDGHDDDLDVTGPLAQHLTSHADHDHDVQQFTADKADAGSHNNAHGNAHCGTGGSCCASATLIASHFHWRALPTGSDTHLASPMPLFAGVTLAGIERPPRFFLVVSVI